MNNFIKITFFSLFLTFISIVNYAQTYDFRNYSLEEGLPQSQVLSICQDGDGYLWMGTNGGGVGKFDGNNFLNYTESEGLINNTVYSIHLTKNGNILLGTNGGLSIFDGHKFYNYDTKDGLENARIYKAVEDKNGVIWVGTPKGVYTFSNNQFSLFDSDTILNRSSVWTIFIDKSKNIWFGTQQDGLIKYNPSNKKFNYYNTDNGLPSNYIWSINEGANGTIYIGTSFGIRAVNKEGKFEKINIPHENNIGFYSIGINENNLWLSTSNGVYKYSENKFERFSVENGLPSNICLVSFIDKEGNLWVGTNGCGTTKLASDAFKSYSSADKLPSDYIETIFEDSKKNVWVAVSEYGVIKIQNNTFTNYRSGISPTSNKLADDMVQAIAEDNLGNIYLGTKDGLSVFDGTNFKNYQLPNNNIYSLKKTVNGIIWIGTKNGLYKYDNGKIIAAPINNSDLTEGENLTIYCIVEDKYNKLWLGTEKGVICYSNKSALVYTKKSGFIDRRVLSIAKDGNDNLWFGTDEGVFSYDYKSFKNITIEDGLISNKSYLVLCDKTNLWIGTNKGLDRLDLLNYYSNKNITIKHYSQEEGFKGIECNRNSAILDSDGNLWFGTVKGVNVFNPKLEKTNFKEPSTKFTGIRLFFDKSDVALKQYSDSLDYKTALPINLTLPYDINHITFDFIGICMTNPTKVKYKYMLEGADNNWSPATSKTDATYPFLNPGEYTFLLKAMNNDGLWNKNPITFKFTILPPWWATWWFYALSGLLLFGSVVLFIRVRTKNLEKAKIELESEVALRTNQLREEKEKVEIVNKEVIQQKAIIEAKNQDITDSIKYAKNIQEAMLPPLSNLFREFKDAFIIYQPKDIVSGDFYWFNKKDNTRLIAAVDCTGHGVPGAFMSIVGNTLLNEIISEKNILSPADILNELHKGIKEALKQNENDQERQDGMDIALCSLNEDNTILEFAGANRPLWIFRKNKPTEEAFEVIKPNKFPIGGMDLEIKRKFTNHTIPVEKGDILYLFSDGFADQFGGPKGKKFMVANLQKKLAEIYTLPIEKQQIELQNSFMMWKGNIEQVDDVLVIAFRI